MSRSAGKMAAISPDDPDYQYLATDRKKLHEEQNQPFDGKKNCWIPDQKEGYVKAEIVSTKGDDVTVLITEKMEVRSTCLSEGVLPPPWTRMRDEPIALFSKRVYVKLVYVY